MSDQPKGSRWFRWILYGFLVLVVLLILLPFSVRAGFEMVGAVVFGWLRFLSRTLPRVQMNLDLIGMAGLCLVGIALGSHWLANWLMSQKPMESEGRRWRWRWTLGGMGLVSLLLLSGMALGGIAHQIGWMRLSEQPMYEPKLHRFNASLAASVISGELDSDGLTLERMRAVVGSQSWARRSLQTGSQLGQVQVYALVESNGEVSGAIVLMMDAKLRQTADFYVVEHGFGERMPADKLREVLEKYRAKLVSL